MRLLCYFILVLAGYSCNTKPNIAEIKQPIFGGLVLGEPISDFNKTINLLIKNKEMFVTENTHAPYFIIETHKITGTDKILLFPKAYFTDSICTEIAYYIYKVDYMSDEVMNHADESSKDRLLSSQLENLNFYSALVNNFEIQNVHDSKFRYNLPLFGSGSALNSYSLRDDISSFLEKKYGPPSTKDTVGKDYHNSTELNYYNKSTWQQKNINISLISRRLPDNPFHFESGTFFHVLFYEYNDKVRKDYKLDQQTKNLKETF